MTLSLRMLACLRPELAALMALACTVGGWALAQEAVDASAPARRVELGRSQAAAPTSAAPDAPRDGELAPYRAELLDLAFDAASAMPLRPHVKSRSLAQEGVLLACLELDQAARAAALAPKIENWRRGTAYAEVALHCIRKGERGDHIERFLERAHVESEAPEEELGQTWRRDRIRAKLAQAYGLLGRQSESLMFRAELENAEALRLSALESERVSDQQFDAVVESLDQAARIGDFDMIRYALDASVALYKRFYSNEKRRAKLEERVQEYWRSAPFGLRIDVLLGFAEAAHAHGAVEHAGELLAQTRDQVAGARWLAADYSRVMKRMSRTYRDVGQLAKAGECVRAALEKFEAEREQIPNFERAAALRPIAEAQAALEERGAALATYRRAVEDGAENPNARCRAEDLAATCSSMAVAGVEPDAELKARLLALRAGLKDPW